MSEVEQRIGAGNGAETKALWPEPEVAKTEPTPWAWLGLLMALAAVLRGIALNQQLWFDEITTLLDFVRTPMAQILTTYTSQNQHMLYSVLARVAVVTFGDAAWTLRLPAAVFGMLSVPALYFCARLLTTRREALLGCALLTVSYHHVWFSQNARGYTGLAFFTLVATYFFIRGAQGEGAGLKAAPTEARGQGRAMWVWYAVALALGMYVHLTMGFIAVGHGLVYLWLLAARKRELGCWPQNAWMPLLGFVLAGVITAALYAPVMGDMIQRTVGAEAKATPLGEGVKSEWKSPLWLLLETARGLGAGSAAIGIAAMAVGGLIVLAGLWSFFRQSPYAVGLMVFPGVVTAAAMLALSRNLWPRFFFFAIGFGLMLIVRGATEWCGLAGRVTKRDAATSLKWSTAVVALMIVASCYQLRAAYLYPKQDYLGAMQYVDAEKKPGDAVALVGLTVIPYRDYYRRDWPQVENVAQLAALRGPGHATWVLYTIPIYVQSRYPELWNILQSECTTVKIFRGTMGGGEVYVCRAEP
ncbi:MAG: glycosyltransferase family 39 protein [Acidobacteria bacterium]|nr:glycosyltransferase family 39 protein [Acidobacteriota bacterium]